MLVYEWVEGELLRRRPDEADSAHERFRALPVPAIVAALDVIFELHQALADAGYVAEDFYDGCLIHDFAAGRIRVIDLDHYHPGPFVNHMGRLFGSSRFMAPEEFERGALIDERTTVLNLGRAGRIFLCDGGGPQRQKVLSKACADDPGERFETVAGFVQAWRACD